MALVLTEEQTMLRDTAEQFFQEKVPVANLRALRNEKSETGYDDAVWKQMAELGFTGIMVPEAYGGTDFGPVGLGLVLEQAGRTLAASPLFASCMVSVAALLAAGTDTQKETWLPKIASGETIATLAIDEKAHHRPHHVWTDAEEDGDGYRLKGNKTFVIDGHVADLLIVAGRTSGGFDNPHGISLFLVPADAPGVHITRTSMVDSRNAANIAFDNVRVEADQMLGAKDAGGDVLEYVLDCGRIGMAAEMLGAIQEVFDRTVDYLKERTQFGKPIGSFQALQHRAAELFGEIEICRSVVLDALSAIEEKRNDIPQMASLAKARLSDASRWVTNEGLQMHGGIGMTDDVDIGLFMKRARVQAATFGDSNFHNDRFATLEGF